MKFFVCCTALLLLLFGIEVSQAGIQSRCMCPTQFKKLSCTKDKRNDRILPNLILSGRDKTSPVYDADFAISWKTYKYWLDRFVCECAERALKQGYHYFGTEFFGECWAGNLSSGIYPEDGVCIDGHFMAPCLKRNCIGTSSSLQMYETYQPDCEQGFERVGCFKDVRNKDLRAMPELTVNDRGSIPWASYDRHLPDLVCRCATDAVKKGFDFFGIQFWGECWTGISSKGLKYYSYGQSPWHKKKCRDRCFRACDTRDRVCTGVGKHNFVYRKAIMDKNGNKVANCPTTHGKGLCHQGSLTGVVELINEFDPTSQAFNGKLRTEHTDWDARFPEFLCNCAVAAEFNGMPWFAVGIRGECVGSLSTPPFNNDGVCVTATGNSCSEPDLCGGEEQVNDSPPSWQIYNISP